MWGAIIAGLAMVVSQIINSSNQKKQQQALIDQQLLADQKQSQFNQTLALDTWNKTNIPAQREQIEKSGLNVGLMYSGKGGSGTTTSAPGQVHSASADARGIDLGAAVGMGMQAKLQKTQMENIDANTRKTNIEADKLAGIDTDKTKTEVAGLQQGVENAKLQNAILQYENKIKEVEANIANLTQEDILKQIAAESDKAVGEAISSRAKGEVDEATYNDKIKQIKQDTSEQQLRMAGQKVNINLSQQQIQKVATEINMAKQNNMREWDKMSQTDREIQIKKLLSNAQVELMNAQELKAWTSIITDMMSGASQVPTGSRKIGF